MSDERNDFDLEVLGPALAERAEKKERYIDAPPAMQGKTPERNLTEGAETLIFRRKE